ncbi:HPr family phosphocarrier protein [Cellulomonas sp. KRMCY2]|uniref:HPr family phosphocarrier protein n=1 Tax=Cellulomonas sp. KRMCY2 TaxID=1304865 RepID=UPI00045EB5E7|nr:HPr family phosphocarrier protein [Cellulomonas sp. KRMCY2]
MAHVALVLVSHSAAAAEGAAEIASQMAPDVTILPAGGTAEGIGTSIDRVGAAIVTALAVTADAGDPGGGVVVLTDLGSAVLTAEAVVELLDAQEAARVRVPDAPLIEGAVAAAVTAQQGGDLVAVEASAVAAGARHPLVAGFADVARGDVAPDGGPGTAPDGRPGAVPYGALTAVVVVRNPLGLHARPAAVLARAVADSGATVRVDGVDGTSVLQLMRLGAVGGRALTVVASGPGARAALDAVVALVDGGFGEA